MVTGAAAPGNQQAPESGPAQTDRRPCSRHGESFETGSDNRFHREIAGLVLVDAGPEHRANPVRFRHGVTREIGALTSTVKETSW